jgi:23S rRNA pseudouridine1911/1915/1917 synthase
VLRVVHEDADLLVVNKPAGLVCHPTKNGEMSSLIGRARLYLGSGISGLGSGDLDANPGPRIPDPRPYLVNRLDRETSGIVLIAKSSAVAGELGKILESRAVKKEYLAIVHGHVRDDHGVIDAPLGKDDRSVVAVKDRVRPDGAPAQTEFFVTDRISRAEGVFSFLRLLPLTGRKHQLRIHLAYLGHPIVGDKLYGHDEDCYLALAQNRLTPEQRAKLILENQALHARSVQFDWRGQAREFSCEPEPWFTDFFQPRMDTDKHG